MCVCVRVHPSLGQPSYLKQHNVAFCRLDDTCRSIRAYDGSGFRVGV